MTGHGQFQLTHPPGGKIVLSFLIGSVLNIFVVLIVIACTNLDDSRRRGLCERIVPFKRCRGVLEVLIGGGRLLLLFGTRCHDISGGSMAEGSAAGR